MGAAPAELQPILDSLLSYHKGADADLVVRCYENALARKQAGGQAKATLKHGLGVASVLTGLKLDEVAVAAALLHEVVEDTEASYQWAASTFGSSVADITQGVVRLSRYRFIDHEERQAESFRRMLLAMFKDVRVALVKLADRVQEMRELEERNDPGLPVASKETLEIYVPLANRLGLYRVKTELEEASFRNLYPEEYKALERQLAEGEATRKKVLEEVKATLKKEVAQMGIPAQVFGREKVRYSIYKKMKKQGVTLDQVYDVVAFRVIVDTVDQCWRVMGLVHELWRPILGRFRDFIGNQKPNGYRSLHTSVVGPEGERMEVQIRTWEMHDIAERGIAAHWKYKEGRAIAPADEARVRYFKSLIEEVTEVAESPAEGPEAYSLVRRELADEEIFVFTPTGAVRVLPKGATPVDFAFTVHSEVGMHCSGAKINGAMLPLSTPLKNGDTVEILTSPHQMPSSDWLRFVKSSRSKARIRAFLLQEAKEKQAQTGRQLVEKELKKYGVSMGRVEKSGKVAEWAKELGISEETLWVQVGSGKLDLADVGVKLAGVVPEPEEEEGKPVLKPVALGEVGPGAGKGKVLVGGQGGVEVRFARCCNPMVGEPIVGFVSKGHGISIHARRCAHTRAMDSIRFVDVAWAVGAHADQIVSIKISAYDAPGMLNAISSVFAQQAVNIRGVTIRSSERSKSAKSGRTRKGDLLVKAEISNASQLKTLLRALLRVEGVIKAERSA